MDGFECYDATSFLCTHAISGRPPSQPPAKRACRSSRSSAAARAAPAAATAAGTACAAAAPVTAGPQPAGPLPLPALAPTQQLGLSGGPFPTVYHSARQLPVQDFAGTGASAAALRPDALAQPADAKQQSAAMGSPSAQRPLQARKKSPLKAVAPQQRRRRLATLRQLQSASPATQSEFSQYILLNGISAGRDPSGQAAAAHPGDAALPAAAALHSPIAALAAPGAPAAPTGLPAGRSAPAGRARHAASQSSNNAAASGAAVSAGSCKQGGVLQSQPGGSCMHCQKAAKGGSCGAQDLTSPCATTGCDCNSLDHISSALSEMAGRALGSASVGPTLQCAWRQLPLDVSADMPKPTQPLQVATCGTAVNREEADTARICSPNLQAHAELGRRKGAGSPNQTRLQHTGKQQLRQKQPDPQPQRGGSGSALAKVEVRCGSGSALAKVEVQSRRDELVSRMLTVTAELQGALEGQLEQLQRSDHRLAEVLRENEVLFPTSFSCRQPRCNRVLSKR